VGSLFSRKRAKDLPMSSDDISIKVEGVGKCFEVYTCPQNRLKQFVLPALQKAIGRNPKCYYDPFWALQDISFEVKRGQSVGIIGQNGSGKSTLLQIIAGILQPTMGKVEVNGRVGALIELGSGFNPEFTGRENVFLNACLLGFTQAEVERKFDSIAAFADIGTHLERPLKTYSSGMMLRLAFAVQMAVEPEILIIDEALAVGDARFQLKCFKRLEELKMNGTTILFVSHAVEMVRSFCDFGVLLEKGKLVYSGDTIAATTQYYAILFPNESNTVPQVAKHEALDHKVLEVVNQKEPSSYIMYFSPKEVDSNTFGAGGASLDKLEMHGLDVPNLIVGGRDCRIICGFSWDQNTIKKLLSEGAYEKDITIGICLADKKGSYIFGCNGFDAGVNINCFEINQCVAEFQFVMPELAEGDYFLTVAIALGTLKHHIQLKWYDCIIPLKFLKSDRNVFGIVAIDYSIKLQNQDGIRDEQITASAIQ
jgi:lipopolysaccharide transport system ATP-binding protein